jgi:hypothetical protein
LQIADFKSANVTLRASPPTARRRATRRELIRKLRGFVVQFETDTVRVSLKDDKTGKRFDYRFPAKVFRDAKIEVENQPFEFIESKVFNTEHNVPVYQSMFLPMAPKESVRLTDLELGEEYDEMRKRIVDRYSKRMK